MEFNNNEAFNIRGIPSEEMDEVRNQGKKTNAENEELIRKGTGLSGTDLHDAINLTEEK